MRTGAHQERLARRWGCCSAWPSPQVPQHQSPGMPDRRDTLISRSLQLTLSASTLAGLTSVKSVSILVLKLLRRLAPAARRTSESGLGIGLRRDADQTLPRV